jgi:hypothetical protein
VGGGGVGVGGGGVGSHFFSLPFPGLSQGAPIALGRNVKAWIRANDNTSAANMRLESVVTDPPRFNCRSFPL